MEKKEEYVELVYFFELIYNWYIGGDMELPNEKHESQLLEEIEKFKHLKPYIGTRR